MYPSHGNNYNIRIIIREYFLAYEFTELRKGFIIFSSEITRRRAILAGAHHQAVRTRRLDPIAMPGPSQHTAVEAPSVMFAGIFGNQFVS